MCSDDLRGSLREDHAKRDGTRDALCGLKNLHRGLAHAPRCFLHGNRSARGDRQHGYHSHRRALEPEGWRLTVTTAQLGLDISFAELLLKSNG